MHILTDVCVATFARDNFAGAFILDVLVRTIPARTLLAIFFLLRISCATTAVTFVPIAARVVVTVHEFEGAEILSKELKKNSNHTHSSSQMPSPTKFGNLQEPTMFFVQASDLAVNVQSRHWHFLQYSKLFAPQQSPPSQLQPALLLSSSHVLSPFQAVVSKRVSIAIISHKFLRECGCE